MEKILTGVFKQLEEMEEDESIEFLDDAREKLIDSLDEIKKDNKSYDFMQFLHGYCDIFIISLFEFAQKHNLNYPIYVIKENESNSTVHCFSMVTHNDTTYYIDVRGITSNKDAFFEEFEDWFSYQSYFEGEESGCNIFCYDSIKKYLKASKVDDFGLFIKMYESANEIINTFSDYYLMEV